MENFLPLFPATGIPPFPFHVRASLYSINLSARERPAACMPRGIAKEDSRGLIFKSFEGFRAVCETRFQLVSPQARCSTSLLHYRELCGIHTDTHCCRQMGNTRSIIHAKVLQSPWVEFLECECEKCRQFFEKCGGFFQDTFLLFNTDSFHPPRLANSQICQQKMGYNVLCQHRW